MYTRKWIFGPEHISNVRVLLEYYSYQVLLVAFLASKMMLEITNRVATILKHIVTMVVVRCCNSFFQIKSLTSPSA